MSDRLIPGTEAKARIQAQPEKDFQGFFDELPVDAMQRVARHLPKIDGFRPTSSLGIARQKSALARKLSRPNATDRDFHGLYLIWREWIYATFKNSATVQELIDQVEDAADSAQDEETRRLAIDNKVDALFAKLNEDSRQNLCTREQIERLLTFSPLPETRTARSMITSAKASSDVDHDTKFNELPERLQRAEGDIKETAAQLRATTERADENMRSVTQALSDIRELRATSTQSKQDIDRLRSDSQRQAAEQSHLKDEVAATGKANDTRFKSFSDQLGELRAAIDSHRAQLPETSRIDEALAKLSVAVAEAAERERVGSFAVTRLQTDLDQLTRDLIALSDDRTVNDKLVSILARITELEARPAVAPTAPAPPTSGPTSLPAAGFGATLRCEPIGIGKVGAATPIEALPQVAVGFSTALQSIGLRKPAADALAEECVAALIARQAVFLKGAFSVPAARVLAASVAASTAIRLSIPLGLENDSDVRVSIEAALAERGTQVGAVVIEAVDTAPMHILREVIFDCLTARRGLTTQSRIAVFATLAEGVASLPVEKAYFELGPLFDLDVLDWRTAYAGDTTISPRTLSQAKDQSFWEDLGKEAVDTDEAVRLARLFNTRPDPAVDQVFVRAYRALHLVRKQAATATPLQSLFYGWLLPYWNLRQVTREQVDAELDGGKVNNTSIDQRLATLLKDFAEEGGTA